MHHKNARSTDPIVPSLNRCLAELLIMKVVQFYSSQLPFLVSMDCLLAAIHKFKVRKTSAGGLII